MIDLNSPPAVAGPYCASIRPRRYTKVSRISPDSYTALLIVTDIWKNFGYGAIVYLAAILGIDTDLYEAAQIDGANRWKQVWHVTLPGMRMIIVLMMVLSLGNVLNAGFDQIFNNPYLRAYSLNVLVKADLNPVS